MPLHVDVTVVRIYTVEGASIIAQIMQYLKDEAKVRGASIFRAVNGFGDSGSQHSSSILDWSVSLPLVIEFFDEKDKIMPILDHLSSIVKKEHIVFYNAKSFG